MHEGWCNIYAGTNLLTAKDIAYRINESQAKAVIVSPTHVEKVNKIVAQCPSLKYLIVTGSASGNWISFETISRRAKYRTKL